MTSILQFPQPKKTSSTLIYRVRFTQWLAPVANDVLETAVVTCAPTGLTITNTTVTADSVIFTVAAGVAGQLYRLDIAFTTDQGQGDTKSVYLRVVA